MNPPVNAATDATEERRVLTVRQLNEEISDAIVRSFPRTVWVRGEVQRFPADAARRTHLYFELHETGASGAAEYAIPVALMSWDRQRFGLGRYVDGSDPDLQIANQLEVCFECQVDFYAKFGKLSLKVVGVDRHFSLGRLEARRREVLAFLRQADLLEANRRRPWPELPLRVGLITAAGSAAERDFLTGLEASPWAFVVEARSARMQGEQLEGQVINALADLVRADVDVVVITRGGGSRADLSWFDQKDLALAIARCPVPVVTAIGHEIDRAIADLVAHRACKTPTAAAEFLIDRVARAAERVDQVAALLAQLTASHLTWARERLAVGPRLARAMRAALLQGRLRVQRDAGQLQRGVASHLRAADARLGDLRSRLERGALVPLARGREHLGELGLGLQNSAAARLTAGKHRQATAERLLRREALQPAMNQAQRIEHLATQVRLLDPERLLARGYTITCGPDGKPLKRAEQIAVGDRLTTRFSDGEVASVVQGRATCGGGAQLGEEKRRGGKTKQGKENTGQESLFGEAVGEVEAILAALEEDEVDIDRLGAEVARAVELIQVCREKLEKTDREVRDLVTGLQASGDDEQPTDAGGSA